MRSTRFSRFILVVTFLLIWGAGLPLAAKKTRIRMGTVAPKGSPWHEALEYVRQEWHRISTGAVDVRIYAGGVLGDGPEMVRQVRAGRIEAVGLSSVGLARIDPGVSCLQVPMMLSSYDELDYVRERIAPKLEHRIEEKGFKVLLWSDAGWVHSFTKEPVRTPDELRKMKLFTSAGDPDTEKLYKEFGFHVVPLALTDMLVSLQTGLIDAVNLPPLFAMLNETYRLAENMIDLKWTPLVAGTVISKRAWERIPEEYRPRMLHAARTAGDRLRERIRRMGDDAVKAMEKRGLEIIELDPAVRAKWQSEAEKTYPQLRGRYAPAQLFDEVQRLRDEFRNSSAHKGGQKQVDTP